MDFDQTCTEALLGGLIDLGAKHKSGELRCPPTALIDVGGRVTTWDAKQWHRSAVLLLHS